LALNYTRPEWVKRSDWEALTLSEMQITCAALEAWVAREISVYVAGTSQTRPMVDFSAPQAALAERGINTEKERRQKTENRMVKTSQGGEELNASGQVVAVEEKEPDKVVYLPKVDIRDGGTHAHWLWRGTRVSDAHISRYCGVKLALDETESGTATVVSLWGPPEAVEEAVELISQVSLATRPRGSTPWKILRCLPPTIRRIAIFHHEALSMWRRRFISSCDSACASSPSSFCCFQLLTRSQLEAD
jgi:hypothetical protein